MYVKRKHIVTYYVRAVPSVNQDLVVGVGLPLHLLGAMGSWGLRFAERRKQETQKGSQLESDPETKPGSVWCSLQPQMEVYLSDMGGVMSLS